MIVYGTSVGAKDTTGSYSTPTATSLRRRRLGHVTPRVTPRVATFNRFLTRTPRAARAGARYRAPTAHAKTPPPPRAGGRGCGRHACGDRCPPTSAPAAAPPRSTATRARAACNNNKQLSGG
eukprot:645997-Prorocentrum_minimum.AAC.4